LITFGTSGVTDEASNVVMQQYCARTVAVPWPLTAAILLLVLTDL